MDLLIASAGLVWGLARYTLYLIRGKMSNKSQPFILKIHTKIR
jgi:hypothetical protein